MKLSKKGIIMHPFVFALVSFLVGAAFVYLTARGVIPLNLAICPS